MLSLRNDKFSYREWNFKSRRNGGPSWSQGVGSGPEQDQNHHRAVLCQPVEPTGAPPGGESYKGANLPQLYGQFTEVVSRLQSGAGNVSSLTS